MTGFNLDTSGAIDWPSGMDPRPLGVAMVGCLGWADLGAFTQGYIEALLSSVRGFHVPHYLKWDERNGHRTPRFLAFRDLAPESLARVIKDCDALRPVPNTADHGRTVWTQRQEGKAGPSFPPLAVRLGDDGKVHLS